MIISGTLGSRGARDPAFMLMKTNPHSVQQRLGPWTAFLAVFICVFVGTSDGRVICINLADKDADGWYAWGGNAQHNKKQ